MKWTQEKYGFSYDDNWGINIEKNDKLEALISILVEKKERKNTSEGGKKEKNWQGCAPNVSWTPTLPPLNTETQCIELTCIYRKMSLKTIYKSDRERDRLLISGTTTVGSNNNHTVNAPRATTQATIDSFVAV